MNKTVDFLIVTDQHLKSDADNIIVKKSSLAFIKQRLDDIFKTDVYLGSPYKLCDLKPFYAMVFNDITSKYDFCGYCDSDLIFGDIRHFLTEDILNKYDYILGWGHFHIQRTNDIKFDQAWKTARGLWRNIGWEEMLISRENEWFDELPYGVSGRYYELFPKSCWMGYSNNQSVLDEPDSKELVFKGLYNDYKIWSQWGGYQNHLKRLPFLNREPDNDLHNIVYKKKGKSLFISGINSNGEIEDREILYVHFYKRKIRVKTENKKQYIIRPNAIVPLFRINKLALLYNSHHPSVYIAYCKYRIKRKLNTIFRSQKVDDSK